MARGSHQLIRLAQLATLLLLLLQARKTLCGITLPSTPLLVRGDGEAARRSLAARVTASVGQDVSPEALCALSLLPSYLGDTGSHSSSLLVVGSQPWLGHLLARLPRAAVADVTLLSEERVRDRDLLLDRMRLNDGVLLLLGDAAMHAHHVARRLSVHLLGRTLAWVSASLNDAELRAKADAILVRGCLFNARLVVTDSDADGATHAYAMRSECAWGEYEDGVIGVVRELDRCTRNGRWLDGGGGVLGPPCQPWRPPARGHQLKAAEFTPDYYWSARRRATLRDVMARITRGFDVEMRSAAGSVFCHADLGVLIESMPVRSMHRALVVFPWQLSDFVMVVPAGLPPQGDDGHDGRGSVALLSITREFRPGLGTAMTVAFLAVVAAFAATSRGRHRSGRSHRDGGALLLAVRPLLSQSAPFVPRGPTRPVLGAWMLACLVVAAHYQGDTLDRLFRRQEPHEIDTVEELVRSNLTLVFTTTTLADTFPWTRLVEAGRLRFSDETQTPYDEVLRRVAERRDMATVMPKTFWSSASRSVRGRVSAFNLDGAQVHVTAFFTRSGSPFEAPLRRIVGRVRAAGLFAGQSAYGDSRRHTLGSRSSRSSRSSRTPTSDPLAAVGLRQVAAALAMLAGGLALATAVFLVELAAPPSF